MTINTDNINDILRLSGDSVDLSPAELGYLEKLEDVSIPVTNCTDYQNVAILFEIRSYTDVAILARFKTLSLKEGCKNISFSRLLKDEYIISGGI